MYTEERITNARQRTSPKQMMGQLLGVLSAFAAIFLFFEYSDLKMHWSLVSNS